MRLDSNGRNVINNIRTVHARRDFAKQITDESVLYLNEDKKRTQKWFHDCGNLNVPLAGTQFGLIRSIAFEEENVKFSMKDSEGHDLTPEQQAQQLTGIKNAESRKPVKYGETSERMNMKDVEYGEYSTKKIDWALDNGIASKKDKATLIRAIDNEIYRGYTIG